MKNSYYFTTSDLIIIPHETIKTLIKHVITNNTLDLVIPAETLFNSQYLKYIKNFIDVNEDKLSQPLAFSNPITPDNIYKVNETQFLQLAFNKTNCFSNCFYKAANQTYYLTLNPYFTEQLENYESKKMTIIINEKDY